MKKLLSATLAALVLPLAAFASIERTVEKSFAVSEGKLFKLNTFSGPVEVQTSDSPNVLISLVEKVDADTDAEADQLLSKMELSFLSDSSGVTVVAKYPEKVKSWFKGWKNPIQLSWRVTVPRVYNLDLNTSGGSISVEDLKGRVAADTSGGGITLGEIDGEVNADTSGGSIKLKSTTGNAKLDTSGGSISVGTVKGKLNADTSGGSIHVKHAESNVRADTSGGSIEVSFYGPVNESTLDTSGGHIEVEVDAKASFNLVADTSAGGVSCDLPIETRGHIERSHLEGKVNGGGALLKLDTSAGGIRIRKH